MIVGLTVFLPAKALALTGPDACNGALELCDRPLDEVVVPGTHNSMSSEEYGWALPNQIHSIPTQLSMGVRGFLIDTHYGKVVGSQVQDWKGDDGSPVGVAQTFLCHSYCPLGASDLVSEFGKVADFLAESPREVLIFVVENGIAPSDFASAVNSSGLADYLYLGSTSSFPTLRQMIASNERVLMLSEGATGDVPWFHHGYAGPLQETPYNFRYDEPLMPTQQAIENLTDPEKLDESCQPNRGGTTGGLFLMNHWVNGYLNGGSAVVPDPAVARILNQPEVLTARARACEQRRAKMPTLLAVDHFGEGDLLAAVDELNGIAPDPEPEPKRARVRLTKPKLVRVRAGKVAKFRVPVKNAGNARAPKVRVCAKGPRRLVRRVSLCARIALKIGQRRIVTLRFPARKRARGRGFVKFTVYAPNGKLTARSTLVVKPKQAKRR